MSDLTDFMRRVYEPQQKLLRAVRSERDRLREALEYIEANAPPECATAAWIARDALSVPRVDA